MSKSSASIGGAADDAPDGQALWPSPSARSPRDSGGFDTPFQEVLEKAKLRRMRGPAGTGAALASTPGAAKEDLQHQIGLVRRLLRQDADDTTGTAPTADPEGEAAKQSPEEGPEAPRWLEGQVGAGVAAGAAPEPDRGSSADGSGWLDSVVLPEPAGSLSDKEVPQPRAGGALPTKPDVLEGSAGEPMPHRRGHVLLLGSLFAVVTAAAAIGWTIWTFTLPQVQRLLTAAAPGYFSESPVFAARNPSSAGPATRAPAEPAEEASTAALKRQLHLAREQIVSVEAARRAAESRLAQREAALAQTRAQLSMSASAAARQQDTRVSEVRQRLERMLASAHGELATTRTEMARRDQAWSEEREQLQAALTQLRQAVGGRDAELLQARREAERGTAAAAVSETARRKLDQQLTAAQREIDTLRLAAGEVRDELGIMSAALAAREQELTARGDALSAAEVRITELAAALRAARDAQADRPEGLPARLETAEAGSVDIVRSNETRDDANENPAAGPWPVAAAPVEPAAPAAPVEPVEPAAAAAVEGGLEEPPAEKVRHGHVAIDRLPRLLESADPGAPASLVVKAGPPRAAGQPVSADSRAASGISALRAALAATKHQTENRLAAGAR